MPELEIYIRILAFILGSMVGSFLNVCIVRMPHDKSIVWPGSHCVHCKKSLSWYDNIPLLSYLFLGGRCRYCRQKISVRYFLVELLTASMFLLFYMYFGLEIILLPYLIMLCGFIVATFIDFGHRIIPDQISMGGMFVGLILSAFIPQLHEQYDPGWSYGRCFMWIIIGICFLAALMNFFRYQKEMNKEDLLSEKIFLGSLIFFVVMEAVLFFTTSYLHAHGWSTLARHCQSLDASLLGVLIGGGSIYAMGVLGDWMFKKESMGGGDIKLMAMVGAFLGWKFAILAFFIAPFFGAIYGITSKFLTKDSTIAYGPFLCLGSLLSLFYGNRIIDIIMHGSIM